MRKEKKLLLQEVKDHIEESQGLIVTEFEKFTPQMAWILMERLTKSNSYFEVVKKRLFNIAQKEANLGIELEKKPGHIGIVFIKGNQIEATKILVEFQKENEKLIEAIIGYLEGKICSKEEIEQIATLPTEEQMKSMIIGTLEALLSGFVSLADILLTSILFCLEEKINLNKKEV